jgi:UDP-N-acetyl-D-glucosamine dehydrogenase
MPRYWVQKVQDALNERGKAVKGSRILVLGVSYKKDIGDLRESPALDIIHLLQEKGAVVEYHDPYVPSFEYDGLDMTCITDLHQALDNIDGVIIATDHSIYNKDMSLGKAPVIVDTRHMIERSR